MVKDPIYTLSFTAASLRLNESIKVAEAASELGITDYNDERLSNFAFTSVNKETSRREYREIRKRLETLTNDQLDILIHGDLISQKQIAFLAVCKFYSIIRDFVIEVIRDKTLVFNYQINESDFTTFVNSKTQLHPELEEFSERTLKKAHQVMIRILEQAGIINNAKDKVIQPQLLQPEVIRVIVEDNPQMLKVFLFSDKDIQDIKY